MTIFGSFHSPGGISEFDVVFANTPTRNVNMRWRGVASPESVRVLIPPLSSPGYSCALVSDILLQGHLYITENYFAFHSNVFGYVTKVKNIDFWRVPKRSLSLSSKDNAMFNKTPHSSFSLQLQIPIRSVVKVSKEKTAKIIPNAVGLATATEKHVSMSL